MSVRITYQMLVGLGACQGAREKFRREYPNGIGATAPVLSTWMFNCSGLWRMGDYAWIIHKLLDARQRTAFLKRAASYMGINSIEGLDITYLLTTFARRFPERAAEGLGQAVALWRKRRKQG